jgi:hypothetical protein
VLLHRCPRPTSAKEGKAVHDVGSRVVSARTWAVVAFGIVVSAFSMALIRAGIEGSTLVTGLIANFGSLLTVGFAAAVILWAAFRFGPTESLRRQWMFIGLGTLSYFVGDVVWAYYEAILGKEIPFPGPPDVFYLLMFPCVAAGLVLAIRSFTPLLDPSRPLVIAGVVTALVTAALWLPVFQPALADTETTGLAKVLGLVYPVADLWLLLFPALTLAILLSRLSGGRLAWPWWAVVAGCAAICFADTMFLVMSNAGTYQSGSSIDLGWWIGYTALAVGASLAVDIQKPKRAGGERS